MRQILQAKTASAPLCDSQARAKGRASARASQPSLGKVSMGQILESNRSLIKEMQEQNKESSRHFSDYGGASNC